MALLLKVKLLSQPVIEYHSSNKLKCKGKFYSVSEVDEHVKNNKIPWRWRLAAGDIERWIKVGPYIVKYWTNATGIKVGFPPVPIEYIVRTGEARWEVYKISKELAKLVSTAEELSRKLSEGLK